LFSFSFVGEDDLDWLGGIHDFLRNLDSDRAGDMEPEVSVSFSLGPSGRVRRDLRSCDGSRLLLANGRNLDDRRERLGFICGICSTGASSESGLDPPEDVSEVPSSMFRPDFSSSSDIVPFSSTIGGSSRSLTRGKYV
jgi:hypothetical protein